MTQYQIAIIGAGPVGSRAAQRLADLGHRVVVLEKHERPGLKSSCTGIIGRECFERFGIDGSCVLQEARSAKIFAPSGDFITVARAETQAYVVDRSAFDRQMAGRAQGAGADYLFSTEVTDIGVTSRGVELRTLREGEPSVLRIDAAVIASGFASRLTERGGMGRITRSIGGAQVEVPTHGIDEVEVYLGHRIAPGFFAWLVPTSPGNARVGLFAKDAPGKHLDALLSSLRAEGKIISSETPPAYGGIPLKPLRKTCADRLLAVGDAAGQVKPTTGGGIYYGLLCADHAADAIHASFAASDLSARSLRAYERAWRHHLGRELRIDYFARALYNRLSDRRIDTLFRVVKDNSIHEAVMDSCYRSFDWHGELVMDGLRRLDPWRHLLGKYLPAYVMQSLRRSR